MTQSVETLPCKCKSLSSNSNLAKEEEEEQEEEEDEIRRITVQGQLRQKVSETWLAHAHDPIYKKGISRRVVI
jgi:hypothetical protein